MLLFALSGLALAEPEVVPEGASAVAAAVQPSGPDRSAPPSVVPPDVLELPEPEVHRLSDAVEVLHVRVPGVRKYTISILARRGMAELDQGRLFESSVGYLFDTATEEHDAASLNELEDLHEVDAWSTMRTHYGVLAVDGAVEELALGLELLGDMVRGPTFPKTDVKRYVQDQGLYYLLRGPSRPRDVASALLGYGWYPADHPYGERPDLDDLDRVKTKSLLASAGAWIDGAPITVLSVGDMAYEDVGPALQAMLAGRGSPGEPAMELDVEPPKGFRVLAAPMPGQEQVTIRLRTTAPSRSDDGHLAAWAGSYVFGGHFLSRLNANLREEKGWTYGSHASFDRTAHDGVLTVSVDVKVENVAGAVREIEAELQRLVDEGVTADELALARSRLVASWNESLVTADDAEGRYLGAVEDGESMAQRRARYLALADVAPEQVQQVAKTHWSADGARLWVFVGEQAGIQAQLDELGWTAEWVEPAAAILGKVPAATP